MVEQLRKGPGSQGQSQINLALEDLGKELGALRERIDTLEARLGRVMRSRAESDGPKVKRPGNGKSVPLANELAEHQERLYELNMQIGVILDLLEI